MIRNIRKGFDFIKSKLSRTSKEGTINNFAEKKGKVSARKSKIAALALTGALVLTGCATHNNNNKVETKPDTGVTNEYHDSYWDSNNDMFAMPDNAQSSQGQQENESSEYHDSYWDSNNDMFSMPSNTSTNLDVYYFENYQTQRIENEPVGLVTKDAHEMFEKYESYNLAYRGIEAMDDDFENKYTYTPEESYRLVSENFNVVDEINKASSSNGKEKEDAELKLSMAKNYYKNWLNYNSDIVLDYEEKAVKNSYQQGETLTVNYFDDFKTETISQEPTGTITKDAYNVFELFESYNLAYRAIESMDDEYQDLYTFTPEEKYTLISEGFNIDEAIKNASSSNQQERENARRQLVMAKQFYQNWLDYNDDIVIDYLEKKVK